MTAQIHETVFHRQDLYLLLGITGNSILFDPTDWGFRPKRFTTAVARGYVCEYAIQNNQIVVRRLLVSSTTGDFPRLGSSDPRPSKYPTASLYDSPDIPITHTGSILIGHSEGMGSIGFIEVANAKDLIELRFELGQLVDEVPQPSQLERFDNFWSRHVGIATSLPLRDDFHLRPLPKEPS